MGSSSSHEWCHLVRDGEIIPVTAMTTTTPRVFVVAVLTMSTVSTISGVGLASLA